MGMNIIKTPSLVLIVILLAVGISSAYALITITFPGDVVVTGDLDVAGPLTGSTITDLDSRIGALEGGT